MRIRHLEDLFHSRGTILQSERLVFLLFIVLVGFPFFPLSGETQITADQIKVLTQCPARIVWVQGVQKTGDVFAKNDELKLVGFDTEDGKGERDILSTPSNYTKPLLTPDGNRVVFSDRNKNKFFIVNWDGTDLKELGTGYAAEVWTDPATGKEWVYVRPAAQNDYPTKSNTTLMRYRLDDLNIQELVWDQTPLDLDNFQLSRDGTRASALCPWPNGGVLDLPNKGWKQLGNGCWTSFAPDNSYLFWIFDGPHRGVNMSRTESPTVRKVDIHQAEGIDGFEVYHPRWSNHTRFITMTGPYKIGDGDNRIGGGGPLVEVYLGQFSSDFKKMDHWVQISHNSKEDIYPDAWIQSGDQSEIPKEAFTGPKPPDPTFNSSNIWPVNQDGLIFLWENGSKNNQVKRGSEDQLCRVEPHGQSRIGSNFDMIIVQGAFTAENIDDSLLQACQKTNALSIEALITPDLLEQDGPARIISFSSNPSSRNVTLGHQGKKLILRLRTPLTGDNGVNPELDLYEFTDLKPHHVIVTYTSGFLVCYVDGKQVLVSEAIQGDFSNWSKQHLVFGNEWDRSRPWKGKIEGIAIYNRFMGKKEAELRHEIYMKKLESRKSPPRLVIEAKLIRVTATPTLQSIAPYRRALVVNEYQVVKILEGSYTNPEIAVAHWAILDGENIVQPKVIDSTKLILESLDDHPELQGERLTLGNPAPTGDIYFQIEE